MPIIGDVFGLTSIYERQVENIDNNNFESWPESATYGYFCGGSANGLDAVDTISRLDLFTEATSEPGNNLPEGRSRLAACSSNSYGYFGGGNGPTETVERIDFSSETFSVPGNNLPQARRQLAALSN